MTRSPLALPYVAVALLFAGSASTGRADIIWNSGTMDVRASANTIGVIHIDDPPLKTLQSGNDSCIASAEAFSDPAAGLASSSVVISTSVGADELGFYGHVDRQPPSSNGGANAEGQASFSFTVTAPRSYLVTNTTTGVAGYFVNSISLVTITNASGQTVLDQGFNQAAPSPVNLSLTPGTYTVDWSISGAPLAGQRTGINWTWKMVPEPASLWLLLLPAALLRRSPRDRQS